MQWTVPNILTALRLLAAPGLSIMFLYFNRPYADWFALILFLGAALTIRAMRLKPLRLWTPQFVPIIATSTQTRIMSICVRSAPRCV